MHKRQLNDSIPKRNHRLESSTVLRWSNGIDLVLDKLFAQHCDCCDTRVEHGVRLCQPCFKQLPRVRYACSRCGQRLGADSELCGPCLARPCPQDATIAPFWFNATLASQIKQFKYLKQPHLAKPLAQMLLHELLQHQTPNLLAKQLRSASFSAIIPIPSAREKLVNRGFNPAAQLALYLGKRLQIPVYCNLLHKKNTAPSQVGSTRAQRLQQMRGQFFVHPEGLTKASEAMAREGGTTRIRLLLVDDVLTTGATLNAASRVLKAHGVEHITALCLALSP